MSILALRALCGSPKPLSTRGYSHTKVPIALAAAVRRSYHVLFDRTLSVAITVHAMPERFRLAMARPAFLMEAS